MAKCVQQLLGAEVFIYRMKIKGSAKKYIFVRKKTLAKRQASFLQKAALLVGDTIKAYGLKPLWLKEVHKSI